LSVRRLKVLPRASDPDGPCCPCLSLSSLFPCANYTGWFAATPAPRRKPLVTRPPSPGGAHSGRSTPTHSVGGSPQPGFRCPEGSRASASARETNRENRKGRPQAAPDSASKSRPSSRSGGDWPQYAEQWVSLAGWRGRAHGRYRCQRLAGENAGSLVNPSCRQRTCSGRLATSFFRLMIH